MTSYELVSHIGGEKQSRYYINGYRVSKIAFYRLRDDAPRLECFSTSAAMNGTAIRFTHHNIAVFEE